MPAKSKIVAELGEVDLILPDRIARSLIANDQVKYYFALLQTARANADHPKVPAPDLKSERIASQIQDTWLDETVSQTRKLPDGRYAVPRSGEITGRIPTLIGTMLACLPDAEREVLERRFERLKSNQDGGQIITGAAIDLMTSGDRSKGDSPHLVVMDAHKAINILQSKTALETVEGASVYGLSERSRRLVTTFMGGLNRTAPLKFDHPGLATTATEHQGRLLIQNDIGTTDAHVLVLRLANLEATLTYTDIHEARLEFFTSLFSQYAVDWQKADTRTSESLESKSYLLTTATYRAKNEADLCRYLDHLGSRIVFLIDWNKMRKRLRGFVDKERAIKILRWAAEHDWGHRGLLEIGGEQALAEAVEYAVGDALHYGDRLDTLIGDDNAECFLCKSMELSSSGLRKGWSKRLILDELKTELKRYFESSRLSIFDLAARHAETGFDVATTLREALDEIPGAGHANLAARAAAWERSADQILNAARDDIRRHSRGPMLLSFFESTDDAIDEMEDAASLVELLQLVPPAGLPIRELRALGDATLAGAQELVKCVECAATISRSDVRDDFDDFLKALGRLIEIEHEADELQRNVRRILVQQTESARALYLVDLISDALEAASDAYAHAGQALRAYLLEEVLA